MYNSDDHNWKDNDKFRSVVIFSKATAIAMLSPVAVVGNAIILATVWRRTFPRTTFHILLSRIALNDLCTGLIAQSCYATSFLISPTKNSKVKDNPNLAAILHTVGEATAHFFVSVTILTITAMSIERWLYMSRSSFITSRRRYFTLILMLFLPLPNVVIRVLIHQNFRYENIYEITMVSDISFCYIIILFAYYKVYKIIRHHQQQIKASEVPTQRFGQNAINMENTKDPLPLGYIFYCCSLYVSYYLLWLFLSILLHVRKLEWSPRKSLLRLYFYLLLSAQFCTFGE